MKTGSKSDDRTLESNDSTTVTNTGSTASEPPSQGENEEDIGSEEELYWLDEIEAILDLMEDKDWEGILDIISQLPDGPVQKRLRKLYQTIQQSYPQFNLTPITMGEFFNTVSYLLEEGHEISAFFLYLRDANQFILKAQMDDKENEFLSFREAINDRIQRGTLVEKQMQFLPDMDWDVFMRDKDRTFAF